MLDLTLNHFDSQPLISVIVPVYNVEKYLDRCVRSLLNQTYTQLEIILVDDGATDKSPEICDRYAREDSRIRVIHKVNGGLSTSRNSGLDVSNGKFIGFIDSDDWIDPDFFEHYLCLILQNNAQVVQGGINKAFEYPGVSKYTDEKIQILHNKDILQDYMYACTTVGQYSVCSCLFKQEVLQNIRFRVGKICEDMDFKYKVLSRCETAVKTNLDKYFYFQSTGSISTSGLIQRDFQQYEAAEALYMLSKDETYGSISFLGKVKKSRVPFSLLCKIAYYGIDDPSIEKKKIVRDLTKEHRHNLPILLKSPMKLNRKIPAILLGINFKCLELPIGILKKLKSK